MHIVLWLLLYWFPAIYVSWEGWRQGCGTGLIYSLIGVVPGLNLVIATLIVLLK